MTESARSQASAYIAPPDPIPDYGRNRFRAGAGVHRGRVHGQSDKTGSAPLSDPVHPGELLASIYHAFGIDPATTVYNHLNQPRELVKAEAITRFFG